ncbi:MAG TPA: hypothetical protein ENI97_05035 [Gammaproteobacteria bacterium]|nr:hypothetical protein [Gammaproteobacteria bacterium]
MSDKDSPLESITITDVLPVDWQQLSDMPSAGEQLRLQRANEALLQNLLLSSNLPEEGEESEDAKAHEHFTRIEARLDLLVDLVTEMLTSNGTLPPARSVTIGAHGLAVHLEDDAADTFPGNALLLIRLYLDPQFPRPLQLYARLLVQQEQGFTVRFSPLEPRLQDLLDKYIFRQHRRAIALARQGENNSFTTI